MTSSELEAVRARAEKLERDNADLPWEGVKFTDTRSDDDRRALLNHVDELRADLVRAGNASRVIHLAWTYTLRITAHLLAHQQARNILDDAGATRLWLALDGIAQQGCSVPGLSFSEQCDCPACIAEDALDGEVAPGLVTTLRAENEKLDRLNDGLRVELQRKDAEIGRLKRVVGDLLREIPEPATGWCSAGELEVCGHPDCQARAAAQNALGEEVRDDAL